MKQRINWPYVTAIIIVIYIYSNFILSPVTLGGDFNFVNYDQFRMYAKQPYVWDYTLANGFGQFTLFTLPFYYYSAITSLITFPINNPFVLHKIIFFFPLVIITFISMSTLSRRLIKNKWAQVLAIILYIINPYFIMLASGGQLGVAFAYGFAPLVLATYIYTNKVQIEEKNHSVQYTLYWFLISALSLAIVISFDSRLALLVLFAITVLYLSTLFTHQNKKELLTSYFIQALITVLLILGFHAYWLIPSIFVQRVSLPQGYATQDAVQFFSFGRLAHAITWMHPNYPENIFGVVREISGLALIIPITAFWLLKKPGKHVMYFSGIALLSAFLAKGTSEPLGGIYLWIFQHVPLMSWFRDSTKFFLLLSISYAILIGLTVQELIQEKARRTRNYVIITIVLICIAYVWLPTIVHQIKGTMAYRTYPEQFSQIEDILKNDKMFGRVLWIPSREMYGYYDANHPAVSLSELRNYPNCIKPLCLAQNDQPNPDRKQFTKADLYKEIDSATNLFDDPYTKDIFKSLAINYVIISPDIDHSMYLYDRKYDREVKNYYSTKVSTVPWLQRESLTEIALYKTREKGALFATGQESNSFRMINPTEYGVKKSNSSEPLVFAQRYDPRWELEVPGQKPISPIETNLGLMEFTIPNSTTNAIKVIYSGQAYAYFGWIMSLVTIMSSLLAILFLYKRGSQ